MATIGELIAALKGEGDDSDPIRPEGSGTSSYSGVDADGEPITGTYDPTVLFDQDDIPDSVKEKIGSYLNQRTSGAEDLSNANKWPVEDTEGVSDYSITDANTGNPTGPTKMTADGYGFTTDFQDALADAINVFESEAAFFDNENVSKTPSGWTIPLSDPPDGHSLLLDEEGKVEEEINKVLEEVHPEHRASNALTNNRWSRGYASPAEGGSFNPTDPDGSWYSTYGVHPALKDKTGLRGYTPDRPYISDDDMYRTYLNRDTTPAPDASDAFQNKTNPWRGLSNWESQWDSLDSASYASGGFEAWEEQYVYARKLVTKLEEMNSDTPDWWYIGKMSFVFGLILKVILTLVAGGIELLIGNPLTPSMFPNLDELESPDQPRKNHMKAYGSRWKSKVLYTPPIDPPASSGFLGDLVGDIAGALTEDASTVERVMGVLGLPIPFNAMKALDEEYDGSNILPGIVGKFFDHIGQLIIEDMTQINYWRPIIGHFFTLMNDIDKWEMPDAPLLAVVDMFLVMFANSPIIRMMRAIIQLMEAYYASGGESGAPQFSLNKSPATDGAWHTEPQFRGMRSRTMQITDKGEHQNKWIAAQSLQMLPSMYLLPNSFAQAVTYATSQQQTFKGHGLYANYKTSFAARTALKDNAAINQQTPEELAASGLINKEGAPFNGEGETNRNRFSPAEVNIMENLLESEYMPFYIQDLRTNEIIAFHAFLNSLDDSYSPTYKSTSGFGRIEDVHIYEKTTRSITVTFMMVAMHKDDLDELYVKLNKLTTLIYPQWSEGTLMETKDSGGNQQRFRQPFSQIPTATPVVRLRIGDIIQNNYNKLNMSRLFGAMDPEFMQGDGEDPNDVQSARRNQEMLALVQADPMNEDWTALDDAASGFPIGSIVDVTLTGAGGEMISEYNMDYGRVRVDRVKRFVANSFTCLVDEYVYAEGLICVVVRFDPSNMPDHLMSELAPGATSMGPETRGEEADYGVIPYSAIHADALSVERNTELIVSHFGLEELTLITRPETQDMADAFLNPETNPYFKSFESSLGRGLAGVVNSLSVNYKLNEIPWDITPGTRGPTAIEVSLGFAVIHDIPPGLDAYGMNRAPIYPVGSSAQGGDAWDAASNVKGLVVTKADENKRKSRK